MATVARLSQAGDLQTSLEVIEFPVELTGTRNILNGTSNVKLPELYGGTRLQLIEGTPNSVLATATGNGVNLGLITKRTSNFKATQTYTLSFQVKTTNVPQLDYNYYMDADEGNSSLLQILGVIPLITDGNWHTYTRTFTSLVSRTGAGLMLAMRGASNGASFEIRKIKMSEDINIDNELWTESPEDLGLTYPNDIQNFNLRLTNKYLLVNEIVEGNNAPLSIQNNGVQIKGQITEGVAI